MQYFIFHFFSFPFHFKKREKEFLSRELSLNVKKQSLGNQTIKLINRIEQRFTQKKTNPNIVDKIGTETSFNKNFVYYLISSENCIKIKELINFW